MQAKVLDQASGKNWTVYQGDSCEVIKGIPDNSVHFIIYSPPFESLYTYSNSERDMGNCKTSMEFARHFRFLIKEMFRALKPGRNMSVHCMDLPKTKERDGVIGLRDFRGILIRMFEKAGFILHSQVTIRKDPVTAMQRTKALGLLHKQILKDSTRSRMGIPDYVVTMKKPGVNDEPVYHSKSEFPVSLWQKWAEPVWGDINPSDTLQRFSAREFDDERHIAPLQLEVIKRCIGLWTNPGDIVLDPFDGIGSTGYVAVEMGRRHVGIELKRSYYQQAVANLKVAERKTKQPTLFEDVAE